MFSIQDIPFSYRGSWLDVSPVVAEGTYADDLHLVSHQTGMHPVFRFTPSFGDGRRADSALDAAADVSVVATPALLTWRHDAGLVELAYEGPDAIRIRGNGPGMRIAAAATTLTPFSGTYLYRDPVDGSHVFTCYETGRRYRVTLLSGVPADIAGVEALGTAERHLTLPAGRPWEIAIEEYATARRPYSSTATFDEIRDAAAKTFATFVETVAPWRSPETPAAELAAYVLWSATVDPAGFLARPAVLMSKHWMDKVWSWDHCFNAIALAAGQPELAWHQFHLPFDHQDESGALPDSVTHSEILYNYVKPPIHGWALRHLRERLPKTPDLVGAGDGPAAGADDQSVAGAGDRLMAGAYERLVRWTEFWLTYRRVPGHELPHYQHGNDSGWDNATTFDGHHVIETADLSALLILQLRQLSELATELHRADEAARWTAAGDRIRSAMLDALWTDDRFAARDAATGESWVSSSLLDLMPIALGAELPGDVSAALARRIETHLTAHGLATEHVDSPDYAADGYWRGPIWAPSTVLIEDGLRRAGHTGLADEISHRFRALCEKSGFAENFDAETGAGLRDRAYTWTASSYLILAAAHEHRRTHS